MLESRKNRQPGTRSSSLPNDFLKLVVEVFSTNFEPGLKAFNVLHPGTRFEARGDIFLDEIVLAVSLVTEGKIAATTSFASTDFDPKASSPTLEDLLNACVDALGAFWGQVLDHEKPEMLEKLGEESLSAFEEIPFHWTMIETGRFRIWVKIDKSNPNLDQLADDWLKKHDPEAAEREAREHAETEALFVTGEKAKRGSGGHGPGSGGQVH